MKSFGRVVLALAGSEWSVSRPCRFTLEEIIPGTHWIGVWVGLRDVLDDVEKREFLTLSGVHFLGGIRMSPLGTPATVWSVIPELAGKSEVLGENLPRCPLSTTNPS
jgi:hypothetical protein